MEKAGRPHWAGRGRGLRDRKARGARICDPRCVSAHGAVCRGPAEEAQGALRLYAAQGEPFGLLPKAVERELRGAHQA